MATTLPVRICFSISNLYSIWLIVGSHTQLRATRAQLHFRVPYLTSLYALNTSLRLILKSNFGNRSRNSWGFRGGREGGRDPFHSFPRIRLHRHRGAFCLLRVYPLSYRRLAPACLPAALTLLPCLAPTSTCRLQWMPLFTFGARKWN